MGANCRGSKSDSRIWGYIGGGKILATVRLCTQDLRVQALLSGSNSPTSCCSGARSIGLCMKLQGVRTLVPEEGVAYIEFARALQSSITHG